MNLQPQHLGQIPGQVLNQASTMLPGMQQQNRIPGQVQNPSIHRGVLNSDGEIVKARRYMEDKILETLLQCPPLSQAGSVNKKIIDLVKRLEESLFKSATTMEEYLNMATLKLRMQYLIKRLPSSNQSQQLPHVNSSPSMGTMIPTPGLQQAGNCSGVGTQSLSSSVVANNKAIASSTANHGNYMPTGSGSGSFGPSDGAFSTGYQQSSAFSINNSMGNNMVTSMGVQRMASQMIPTPGFNNPNNNNNNIVNNNTNNPTFMNMESSYSAVESIASQPMQQKQRISGQNSRILHNIGGHMGGGIRSTLQQQQKSYGGLGMIGNNMSIMNNPVTTEGYLSGPMYGNSTKPLHQHFDQHHRPVSQADTSGSGNLYIPASSAASMMNNQSLNSMPAQSMPKTNPPLMIDNQSNAHSTQQQVKNVKPPLIDQSVKMEFQPQYSVRENNHQLQQSSHQLQRQQQQLVQHGLQSQSQFLSRNDTFGQSHISTNMVSEAMPGHGPIPHDEGRPSQVSDPFQLSDTQNQFQHNSMEDKIQFVENTQSDFGGFSGGEWYSESQDASLMSARLPHNQNTQEVFRQRLNGLDVAQSNNLSSEESTIGQSDASKSAQPPNMGNAMCQTNGNLSRDRQFRNQQRWLLFLRHARRCPAPEGKCPEPNCLTVQKLLKHIEQCNIFQCSYSRCCATRVLVNHHRRCQNTGCPVCIPVKHYVQQAQSKAIARSDFNSGLLPSVNGSCKPYESSSKIGGSSTTPMTSPMVAGTPEDLQPSIKRMKIELGSHPVVSESEKSVVMASSVKGFSLQDAQQHDSRIPTKSEIVEVKMEILGTVGQLGSKMIEMKKDNVADAYNQRLEVDSTAQNNHVGFGAPEANKNEMEIEQAKVENMPLPSESISKSGKPKIKGVSLMELFTPDQIRQHITGLRQWVGQSKAKAEKNQAMGHSMSENSCQLCAVERLTFEPPPTYCTPCGARIKRNAMYYTVGAGETCYFFCIPCYNETRGDAILVDGTPMQKARMEKKKNDEETEEWWVQCDKCEAWQHQICALFNGRRNDGGQAEYTCPNCYMKEVENGERLPLPQSAVLGAKDLPRTILSDHIEERLFAKLKQERMDRARAQDKSYDEVLGADSLVVRVVSSVDKKLEVKPRFLEIFQEENYPEEYPYKSKVVLLFQKIEGVEVCLFGMYVQEFGSECQQPNHRRVYLSYLDSVKYFRPEVKTVTGEALRTYVYHEILIGYLEYCKLRGFTSCYIWACPPLKGEDYILYCHPEIQKTPKSDKLREWYLAMLRKAAKENIVSELTNMYDHFFVSTGECKAKVTATRLPYFDGDYWPGAAEDMIFQLRQEEDGIKMHKKGLLRKTITKRALKASGQTDLSGNASKDILLMHNLGETISPMKEDFIMVHLQRACTHCCILMVSGTFWACKQCKNFQLCEKCYDAERRREDRERHPIHLRDKHPLYSIEIAAVPEDTKDRDEILESEFFDTRQAFLSLCQGNHYQYDTLRRAKHSSMMVLYHLHNPTAPAFVTTCNACHLDIETGQGWRCETCPDYDVCNTCYSKDGGIDHPHKLTNNPSSDRDAQNTEAREMRVTQLRKMLELLVHASQCRAPCQYPNCRKVKGLFRHGMVCKVRVSGGCVLCKKMWHLLHLHARACKESKCIVPRCKDLKEHMRRLQQQSDSRRRAAVMEMMRQRAAEVSSN